MYAQQQIAPKKYSRILSTVVLFVVIGGSVSAGLYITDRHRWARDHVNKSVDYFDAGNYAQAAMQCRMALRIDPHYPRAHNYLGWDLYHMGQVQEAIAECRQAVSLDSTDQSAHNNLGYLLYQTGDTAGAKREWLKSIDIGKGEDADQARAYIKRFNL